MQNKVLFSVSIQSQVKDNTHKFYEFIRITRFSKHWVHSPTRCIMYELLFPLFVLV